MFIYYWWASHFFNAFVYCYYLLLALSHIFGVFIYRQCVSLHYLNSAFVVGEALLKLCFIFLPFHALLWNSVVTSLWSQSSCYWLFATLVASCFLLSRVCCAGFSFCTYSLVQQNITMTVVFIFVVLLLSQLMYGCHLKWLVLLNKTNLIPFKAEVNLLLILWCVQHDQSMPQVEIAVNYHTWTSKITGFIFDILLILTAKKKPKITIKYYNYWQYSKWNLKILCFTSMANLEGHPWKPHWRSRGAILTLHYSTTVRLY